MEEIYLSDCEHLISGITMARAKVGSENGRIINSSQFIVVLLSRPGSLADGSRHVSGESRVSTSRSPEQ